MTGLNWVKKLWTSFINNKMKKIANILLCGLGLNVIEYIIVLLCIHVGDVIRYSVPVTRMGGALRDVSELFLLRLIFYFVLWVIGVRLLYGVINLRNPALKLAVVNCLLYLVISLIMTIFIPGTRDFFQRDFFFFLVAATFISPFVLFRLPFWGRVVANF